MSGTGGVPCRPVASITRPPLVITLAVPSLRLAAAAKLSGVPNAIAPGVMSARVW
jgi:hypothetical protein